MKMRASSTFPFLLSLLVISCNGRYELKDDKTGRTLRLDRATGDVRVIEGNAMVKLQDAAVAPSTEERKNENLRRLAQGKSWRDVSLPTIDKNLLASLRTSYRNGSILYQFSLKPKSVAIAQAMETDHLNKKNFVVTIYDASYFAIVKIPIPLHEIVRIIADDGTITGYEATGAHPCDQQTYEDARDWAIQWQL